MSFFDIITMVETMLQNLLIAVIPVVLVGIYIYKQDTEKEPLSILIKLLLGGLLSAITVVIVSNIYEAFSLNIAKELSKMSIIEILIYSFIEIALIEEGSKFLFLYLFAYNAKEYDYTFDMVVYGAFTSLGFALIENILYVLYYGAIIGIKRALTAIILHACCGVLMGLILGKAKEKEIIKEKNTHIKLLAILVPCIVHGMYDYCAFTNELEFLITIVIVITTLCIIFVSNKSSQDRVLIYTSEY